MTGKLLPAIPLLPKTPRSRKPQNKTLVSGKGLHMEVCCRESRL